jgi:hypothetical protein
VSGATIAVSGRDNDSKSEQNSNQTNTNEIQEAKQSWMKSTEHTPALHLHAT